MVPITERAVERLRAGQRLDVQEFLRRWEAMPELKFAELIDGVVYMPSPQTRLPRGRNYSLLNDRLSTARAAW